MDAGPVVVGVDGSDASLRAVSWAAEYAARHEAGLRIVHAIGMTDFFPGGAMSPSTELYGLLEENAAAVIAEADAAAAASAVPGVDVATETTTDPPVVALIEESKTATAVVLGESGHGAFTGLLLGSKTISLAAHAHCPVIAVRGRTDRDTTAPVVVGVDGSALSDDALGHAFQQAALRHVPLVATHAYSDAHAEERLLEDRVATWAQRYPSVRVERDIVRGKPRERLLEHCGSASMVVVGSRGRGGFSGLLLGSTSQALLHHADCPVMVVRPGCTGGCPPAG